MTIQGRKGSPCAEGPCSFWSQRNWPHLLTTRLTHSEEPARFADSAPGSPIDTWLSDQIPSLPGCWGVWVQCPVATLWLSQELCHPWSPAFLGMDSTCPATAAALGSRVPLGCQGFLQPVFPRRDRNQRRLLPWKPCWQQ